MGMPISIDILGGKPAIFNQAFERLQQIDARFSTYKESSEVSRFTRGELEKPSNEFSQVEKACERWRSNTGGYFSSTYGGEYDPSGYVKSWAITEAAKLIKRAGHSTFCIGAGGDILAAGSKVWRIGLQDPLNSQKIFETVELKSGAVATSGGSARGPHIINPKTNQPAKHWASISIVGPDIITADILATAAFAAGEEASELVGRFRGYKMLGIVAGEVVGNDSGWA